MLFDWLVVGQVMPMNPASSVRGPKYVTKRGKTPVLSSDDARRLLDSIPLTRRVKDENGNREVPNLVGLRDRALIGTMVYSFARVSAVCGMRVDDYYQNGKRFWIRLHEKGGKHHEVPAHHNAEAYIDAYLKAVGIGAEPGTPLFRSFRGRSGEITEDGVTRTDVFRMVKRRAKDAGLSATTCCHTFRATGITAYLVLTVLVALGLILSHPVNQSTWKLSKRLFPWHENLFVFVVSFVVAHVVALILDPYADVSVVGAFVPGLSGYRTVPVAVGSVALYALLLTGLTARYTKALPSGWWLKLHRLSLGVFLLSWAHGMLAGTDSGALRWLYVATGLVVIAAAAYRYWVAKKRRPTFSTSLPDTRPSIHAAGTPDPRVSTLVPEEPTR
jgi:DMSO/TMAO reductase YedYZ heme-binding membrane subunit